MVEGRRDAEVLGGAGLVDWWCLVVVLCACVRVALLGPPGC